MAVALLALLGIAFATCCYWLIAWIVNNRRQLAKRPIRAIIGLLVFYVVSLPVALMIADTRGMPGFARDVMLAAYRPLLSLFVWMSGDTL